MKTPTGPVHPCPYCKGRKDRTLEELGLEPGPLEREPAHDPECPLLRPIRLRWKLSALSVLAAALAPSLASPGCQPNSVDPGPTMGGLDNGTVGMGEEEEGGQSRKTA